MREIVLDTETTGLDPAEGHRIVEIAALELENHLPTGRTWHQYLNPDRPMPPEAFEVHGLSDEFLRDKPRFSSLAADFLAFIGEAKLVIHNASFDMRFLNAELTALGHRRLPDDQAIDTLIIARNRFPGAPASLDALCRRFGVDNSGRVKHGACWTASCWPRSIWNCVAGDSGVASGHCRARTGTRCGDRAGACPPQRPPRPPAPPRDRGRGGRPCGLCRQAGRGGDLAAAWRAGGGLTVRLFLRIVLVSCCWSARRRCGSARNWRGCRRC